MSRHECTEDLFLKDASYILPDNPRIAMHMLGNAVSPPPARDLLLAIKEAA